MDVRRGFVRRGRIVTLAVATAVLLLLVNDRPGPPDKIAPRPPPARVAPVSQETGERKPLAPDADATRFQEARQAMLEDDLRGRDITDPKVLEVMGRVPRHRFVSEQQASVAYGDHPLPIGHGQTISQPYIVALMTQLAQPKPESRALDIGTGSGYQAAVLAELCREVCSIEIVQPLAEEAEKRLAELGYKNIMVRHGDGYQGWPEKAPFDVIIVAAAPPEVPPPLVNQLAPGGRLIIPVGGHPQELLVLEKRSDGTIHRRSTVPVLFVPMTGEAEKREGRMTKFK